MTYPNYRDPKIDWEALEDVHHPRHQEALNKYNIEVETHNRNYACGEAGENDGLELQARVPGALPLAGEYDCLSPETIKWHEAQKDKRTAEINAVSEDDQWEGDK